MRHGCYWCDLIKSEWLCNEIWGEQFDYLGSGEQNACYQSQIQVEAEGLKHAKNLEEQIWFNQRWNLNSSRHP